MVEANTEGDGIERTVQYGVWRTDKEAQEGYSRELVPVDVSPEFYDDLDGQPWEFPELKTLMDCFKRQVESRPDADFLGTRPKLDTLDDKGKPMFGEYEWQTFAQVDEKVTKAARGIRALNLSPVVEAEDKQWRFLGVWAQNRWEWTVLTLACMHYKTTVVGFYDAMSLEQVDFILNQTEMTTIACTKNYADKLVSLKRQGKGQTLANLILMEPAVPEDLQAAAGEQGIRVVTLDQVMQEGQSVAESVDPFEPAAAMDVHVISYTSGTTGDSKGVKLSHYNILAGARCTGSNSDMAAGDAIISYLPYTHSFEQGLLGFALMRGMRIGFYQGNPLKLVEDCQLLKPAFFPSVPRLYNRIYTSIKTKFQQVGCLGRVALNRGIDKKLANLEQTGEVNDWFYDSLFFNKASQLLGGNVRQMVTGSAPIDKQVIDFLKICFSCTIQEGYGLTESSASGLIMRKDDKVTGHVGGPIQCTKIRLMDVPEMEYRSSDQPYPRGEICLKGMTMFQGYFKRADKTAEAFDAEGWFHTGDIVQVYPNGSVKIIDRLKNIFKLSQGEYIAPEKLENIYVLSPLIGQIMVYGDSKKNNTVAVVVPEEQATVEWAKTNEVQGSFEEIARDARLKKALQQEIATLSQENKLSSLEKPRDIIVDPSQFTVDNNMMTPTFKLKRHVIAQHYKDQFDDIYDRIQQQDEQRDRERARQQ